MTSEQKQKLVEAGKLVKQAFPDIYGSVRFNLHPDRQKVNINFVMEQSVIINPNEPNK